MRKIKKVQTFVKRNGRWYFEGNPTSHNRLKGIIEEFAAHTADWAGSMPHDEGEAFRESVEGKKRELLAVVDRFVTKRKQP